MVLVKIEVKVGLNMISILHLFMVLKKLLHSPLSSLAPTISINICAQSNIVWNLKILKKYLIQTCNLIQVPPIISFVVAVPWIECKKSTLQSFISEYKITQHQRKKASYNLCSVNYYECCAGFFWKTYRRLEVLVWLGMSVKCYPVDCVTFLEKRKGYSHFVPVEIHASDKHLQVSKSKLIHFWCSGKTWNRFWNICFQDYFCRWWNEDALQEKYGLLEVSNQRQIRSKKAKQEKTCKIWSQKLSEELIVFARLVQALQEKRVMLQNGFIVESFLKVRCSNLVLRNGNALKWLTLNIHCIADFFAFLNHKRYISLSVESSWKCKCKELLIHTQNAYLFVGTL